MTTTGSAIAPRKPQNQARPNDAEIHRETAITSAIFRSRRHRGVCSSKWPNTMFPIANIVEMTATSNQMAEPLPTVAPCAVSLVQKHSPRHCDDYEGIA
jgi:hypothetical protein